MLRVSEHRIARPRFPVVDAHGHLGRWLSPDEGWVVPDVGELLTLMERTRIGSIVNLDGRWGGELDANLDRYDRAYPGRFATFCHLDWREAAASGFTERLVAGLCRSADQGARGVKVWKDLGLTVRDDRGDVLRCDDPRLSDVWDAAGELGLPVLIHTADPLAFFEAVDERNERLEELLEHPDWWFGDRERFPSFTTLIEGLETIVAVHPGTTFIGAHVGCFPEDLTWVGRALADHPNLCVDIAARIAELGRQPRAARALILAHPDRVLFGSDVFPPSVEEYAIHFRFLETEDEHFPYSPEQVPPQGRWAISGLGLPDDVLAAVYGGNAKRLIPGLSP